jgi:hypothetical protein
MVGGAVVGREEQERAKVVRAAGEEKLTRRALHGGRAPCQRARELEEENAVSKNTLIGTLALGLLAVSAARAQDKPAAPPAAGSSAPAAPAAGARPKWVVACEADVKKHCAEVAKTNGDVRPCLAEKEKDLSQECQDTFIRQYKIVLLCKDDIDKLCGGASDGKAVAQCFNDKRDQLSAKCKSALTRASKEHDKEAKPEAKAEAKPETEAAPKKKKASAKAKPAN